MFNLTQYFQLVRGYSPFQAGLRTIALAIGFGRGGQLAQRIRARLGARPAIVGGLVVAGGLLTVFSSVGATTPYWLIAAALTLTGAAFAWC